jgi:ProP effector
MMQSKDTTRKNRLLIIDWLIEHFPAAFSKKMNQIKPLKIGIFEDIIEFYDRLDSPPFSKKSLRDALNYYSGSPAYLKAQQTGAARVDLYGNEIELVTDEQARFAHKRFIERYQNHQQQNN